MQTLSFMMVGIMVFIELRKCKGKIKKVKEEKEAEEGKTTWTKYIIHKVVI